MFNGLIAYFYAEIRSTYRDKYPFIVAYIKTLRYLLAYVVLAAVTRLF